VCQLLAKLSTLSGVSSCDNKDTAKLKQRKCLLEDPDMHHDSHDDPSYRMMQVRWSHREAVPTVPGLDYNNIYANVKVTLVTVSNGCSASTQELTCMGSPVIMDSSTALLPAVMLPSVGMDWPGRTSRMSPTCRHTRHVV
jgi:hypothetical protein